MPRFSESPIRVMVVDDHDMIRVGADAMLATAPDIQLVGEANDGLQAVEQAAACSPHVILMDLLMPGIDGAEAIRRILANQPETRIIVMTGSDVVTEIFEAIEAGACGYLAKTSSLEELLTAIRKVARGETFLPPELTRLLVSHLKNRPPLPETLTPRETEVLNLLARGYSNHQIGEDLGMRNVTVRTHVSRILAKLGVENRVAAALYVLRTSGGSFTDLP